MRRVRLSEFASDHRLVIVRLLLVVTVVTPLIRAGVGWFGGLGISPEITAALSDVLLYLSLSMSVILLVAMVTDIWYENCGSESCPGEMYFYEMASKVRNLIRRQIKRNADIRLTVLGLRMERMWPYISHLLHMPGWRTHSASIDIVLVMPDPEDELNAAEEALKSAEHALSEVVDAASKADEYFTAKKKADRAAVRVADARLALAHAEDIKARIREINNKRDYMLAGQPRMRGCLDFCSIELCYLSGPSDHTVGIMLEYDEEQLVYVSKAEESSAGNSSSVAHKEYKQTSDAEMIEMFDGFRQNVRIKRVEVTKPMKTAVISEVPVQVAAP